MAKAEGVKSRNFYAEAKNNPELLERRRKEKERMDAAVKHMLDRAPGRVPDWEHQRLMLLDRFCLQHGKRCIMWDDDGSGFYLMMNWDWLRNRPAHPASEEEHTNPGWWVNIRKIMRPPLLDPDVPEDKLAAWVDAHTMRVHGFLDKLGKLQREEASGQLVLDHPYWQELQQLPPWPPTEADARLDAMMDAVEERMAHPAGF